MDASFINFPAVSPLNIPIPPSLKGALRRMLAGLRADVERALAARLARRSPHARLQDWDL